MSLAETISGVENRRWRLVYVFVLPLALLWNMWKIKIFDLMSFHLSIFLQNGGMFMKVKSPGTLLNTIIIYICVSFQRGFLPHTWAEPGSTPRLPPFPCIPQTSAAPTKLPIQFAVSANNCNNNKEIHHLINTQCIFCIRLSIPWKHLFQEPGTAKKRPNGRPYSCVVKLRSL